MASFHAFTAGMFSSDKLHLLQADSEGLRSLVTDRLAELVNRLPASIDAAAPPRSPKSAYGTGWSF